MVSSVAPIKAKKVRYYSDANFQRRVLPPLCSLRALRRRAFLTARRLERADGSSRSGGACNRSR